MCRRQPYSLVLAFFLLPLPRWFLSFEWLIQMPHLGLLSHESLILSASDQLSLSVAAHMRKDITYLLVWNINVYKLKTCLSFSKIKVLGPWAFDQVYSSRFESPPMKQATHPGRKLWPPLQHSCHHCTSLYILPGRVQHWARQFLPQWTT